MILLRALSYKVHKSLPNRNPAGIESQKLGQKSSEGLQTFAPIFGWADGWIGDMDVWVDGWSGWMDGWMDGWLMDGWVVEWLIGWMDGWMDG